MFEETTKVKSETWAAPAFALISSSALLCAAILLAHISNGTYDISEWSGPTVFYVTIIFAIFVSTWAWYLDFMEFLNVNKAISKISDSEEYIKACKKPFDVIMSHYGKVGSIGLILLVSMYVSKDVIKFKPSLGAALLGVLCVVGFASYTLVFLKLVNYSYQSKSFIFYLVACSLALFIDTQALEIIVRSYPG